MKIGIAQINSTVGDLAGNSERILKAYRALDEQGAEIVLTPELALTGYPPQDLLFKSRFVPENLLALERLHAELNTAALVVGFLAPNLSEHGRPFHNAAAVLEKGRPPRIVHKTLLPTYDVFDEARYFEPGCGSQPLVIKGRSYGITICEDIWPREYLPRSLYLHSPVAQLVSAGAEAILNLSASPFQIGKPAQRRAMIAGLARKFAVPFFYCNSAGGNDQLVFDGNSLAVSASGGILWQGQSFAEDIAFVTDHNVTPIIDRPDMADLNDALTLGLRDYMAKCGFKTCVLGLSGGIDSAVTACIAVQAVRKENVTGVAMPAQFSSQHSLDDAIALSANLGIACRTIPIQHSFEVFKHQMRDAFAGRAEDITEENMQAR
ncbi:MAG: NAD(+) synthase, partial [Verrucomicrobiota bacterium]